MKRAACSCASPVRAWRRAATTCCPCRCVSAAVRSAARCRGRRRNRWRRSRRSSLFAGLPVPPEVTVNRQVLADPAMLGPERARVGAAEGRHAARHRRASAARARSSCSTSPPTRIGRTCRCRDCSSRCCAASRRSGALAAVGASASGETKAADGSAPAESRRSCRRCRRSTATARSRPRRRRRKPITSEQVQDLVPNVEHPPGYYGPAGSSARA